ncbi:MAG: glycoside hydrolase family 25 protein [Lachnospiraceae bacterium]|nr:glycoside hydrolase family 25 protein [Lachnospiraceae bacterium]
MSRKLVIDVSEHQGIINWNKVKNKVDGAILRCGYGDDVASQDDKQYARNLAECEKLGIPKGVYLYSYAKTETQAKSELAHILRLIKGHKFELPIFLDCEESGTQNFAPTACRIVCEGLKAAGYTPGVYSSIYWWNNYLTSLNSYKRWIAQWDTEITYKGNYLMWQYSESGRVDGIDTEVDMNYLYGNIGENNESVPDILYQVFTETSGWLPTVKNLEDYAGIDGQPIKGIRVFLNGDTLSVQTHQLYNGNIDKLTILAGKHTIRYRVRTVGSSNYLSWMERETDTSGSDDTFAGESGKAIDRVQMVVKE